MIADPCPKVHAKVTQDRKHGKTTSEAMKDFIRRTCECASCAAWRREQSKLKARV